MDFSQFLSDLLATLIGLAFGIPVAVGIYRWQEGRGRAESAKAEAERRDKLLRLTREELADCLKLMKDRYQMSHSHPTGQYIGHRLKTELWRALSDGGELRWIKDLDLMASLATAYHRLGETVFLEGMYVQLYPEHEKAIRENQLHVMWDLLGRSYEKAIDAAEKAIKAIDDALGGPKR